MSEEARASQRLKTLEFGIFLGEKYGEYLEQIELTSKTEMLRALTKIEMDWDEINHFSREAGWLFEKLDYEESFLSEEDEEEENEEPLRYELLFTPFDKPDKELEKIMNEIKRQRILINVLFSDRFGFELFKEAESDSRITCIPWEGYNDWNALLCVVALASYLIERLDEARLRQELIRMLQTMSYTIADRTDLDQLKGIELLRTFLETHNYQGHMYGGAIVKLKSIQRLRSATKPIHFTDAGFKNFVEQYGLEDKLDPETKEGDFYVLIYKVLEVALEALNELYQTLEES